MYPQTLQMPKISTEYRQNRYELKFSKKRSNIYIIMLINENRPIKTVFKDLPTALNDILYCTINDLFSENQLLNIGCVLIYVFNKQHYF